MNLHRKLFPISILLLFLLSVSILGVSASSEDVDNLAITQAEETLGSVFKAVLEAEDAGANISSLLGRLNLGSEYLTEAYVWHRLGVSEKASRFADLCVEVVEGVGSEAFELGEEAKKLEDADFSVTMFESVAGVVAVVVLAFVVWWVFRKQYLKQVLDSKPEVDSGES